MEGQHNLDNPIVGLKAIDLFCGAGGSSCGAYAAGVRIVAGFDLWGTAGEVYKENFRQTRFVPERLENHDPMQLRRELGPVDLLLASPECTNHSPAKGNLPRCEKSRETAFQVTRFAEAFEPRWIVVENVIGMSRWPRYHEFIQSLGALGYRFREERLNAADFGVAQKRRRLFILFDRKKKPCAIEPTGKEWIPARSFIDRNGAYQYSLLRTERRAEATLERADRAIGALGGEQDFLIVYYGSDKAGGWQRIDEPLRTITTLDRFALVKPSPQGHRMRMLQPEELKLAMSWPEDFRIQRGTRRDRIRMIGNAVCPKVMQAVVSQLVS
uniref:DNA (cytosine-5-)-methyltransferase n=1 Tax=Candidatus Kentrum sp. LPFa TaxID=2126335 RepID=A0A450XHL9_9GAMM|nr:MAG: DNA (cytosine-5)-methyltransferase 1 [Candidatus Kentron sp. LPFa]VFK28802.1 MAG: DNA (cytosine-5)-methyltransferase 1 [Candidatus Kentron sp. LPFa]